MRTLLISILVSAFLAVSAIGCDKEKAADPAPAAEKAEPAAKDEAKKPEAKKSEAKKSEAKKPEAKKPEAKNPAADGKASAADCKAACDNVTKVLMALLPAETPDADKAEVMKELASCPADCVKETSAAEAKCLAAAKTEADMEKCAGDE